MTLVRAHGIVSTQELIVELEETDLQSPDQLELTSSEGNRSHPVEFKRAGERWHAVFRPVTSRRIFQRAGVRGDLDSLFSLAIKTQAGEKNISLVVGGAYKASVNRFGLPSRKVYVLEDFRQSPSGQKNAGPARPLVRNNEYLDNGFWMKFEAVYNDGYMNIQIRMVNQSMKDIHVDLKQVRLNDVQPDFDPSIKNPLLLKNGRRGEVKLQFKIIEQNSYALHLAGVKFGADHPSVVLEEPLKLSVLNIDALAGM